MVGGLLHIVCSAWNVIFSWVSSGVSLVVGGVGGGVLGGVGGGVLGGVGGGVLGGLGMGTIDAIISLASEVIMAMLRGLISGIHIPW